MSQEDVNALNNTIRNLNIFDKLKILDFAQGEIESLLENDKLCKVADETFAYMLFNDEHLPEALNPSTWDSKEGKFDLNDAIRNLNNSEKARVLAFFRGNKELAKIDDNEKLAEVAAGTIYYWLENGHLPEAFNCSIWE